VPPLLAILRHESEGSSDLFLARPAPCGLFMLFIKVEFKDVILGQSVDFSIFLKKEKGKKNLFNPV